MKRSLRLFITGTVQSMFFEQFIKNNADQIGIKGYFRKLDDGRAEIFLEGDTEQVDKMLQIARRGPQHMQVRKLEEKEEKFQGFKEFKILKI